MRITGYGNASVKIEAGERVLFFDPYQKDLVPVQETQAQREVRKKAFSEANDILITHGHFDHLGSISALYGERDVNIYCTKTPAETLRRQGFAEEKIHVIAPGEELAFGGSTVKLYHTEHCRFNAGEIWNVLVKHHALQKLGKLLRLLALNRAYPSGGECLLYEICAENLRVQLLGSAGLAEDVDYPTGADALLLPYQGRSDMADYCMKIVERLKPKRVILDHFDDAFPPMTCREETEPFEIRLREKYPQMICNVLEEMAIIEL